jgi:transposase-like protein
MATIRKFKLSEAERRRRHFSEEFKVRKVREIDSGQCNIADICKEYEVSNVAVRRWRIKYSNKFKTSTRLIVESESDTKKIQELKAKIAELERLLGQKQVQLEFKDKMIELAEEVYKVDIKKKFDSKHSSGSGDIGQA